MPARLVALDEGSDIYVDRAMVVVGRHPQCDARLDSIRVSRRHCCMTNDNGEVVVRDLGSTNGIRINGQRVESGRLRAGDELSIAHIRFRLDSDNGHEMTLAESIGGGNMNKGRDRELDVDREEDGHRVPYRARPLPMAAMPVDQNPLAAAVRDMLPSGIADRCRIQVIVQMKSDDDPDSDSNPSPAGFNSDEPAIPDPDSEEVADPCRPDSSP